MSSAQCSERNHPRSAGRASAPSPNRGAKMRNRKDPGSTFSAQAKGGRWSTAHGQASAAQRHGIAGASPQGHPHPTSQTQKPLPPSVIPKTSLRTALETSELLGCAIPGDSWLAWRSLLYAIMGEPLRPEELQLFQKLTERPTAPTERVREFYGIIGRRGGKSRSIATLLAYLATLVDYRGKLT